MELKWRVEKSYFWSQNESIRSLKKYGLQGMISLSLLIESAENIKVSNKVILLIMFFTEPLPKLFFNLD